MQPSQDDLLDRLATLEATVRHMQRRRRDRRTVAGIATLAVLTGLTLWAQGSSRQPWCARLFGSSEREARRS